MARKKNLLGASKLLTPSALSIMKGDDGTGNVTDVTLSMLSSSFPGSTGSFDLDTLGSALKSTQQIPLDWSKFENHAFFDSAESKVNVAFDTIVNYYPFDGTAEDRADFFEALTGFEKWVYDQWPKHKGYLHFSGTQSGEDPENGYAKNLGTYISVTDRAGYLYPSISRDNTQKTILDPGESGFSLEFFLNVPSQANSNQIIFQKLYDETHGFTLCLNAKSDADNGRMSFYVSSGSTAISSSINFSKGEFQHFAAVFDRAPSSLGSLKLYNKGNWIDTSATSANFGSMGDFSVSTFYIGTGSVHQLGDLDATDFTPAQTLSASIDELKFYHGTRTVSTINLETSGSVFPEDPLKLYFKFNEGTGSYTNNDIVLDSSGNSLHSRVTNFADSLRLTGSVPPPVEVENSYYSPVLFPSFYDVTSLNTELLLSASQYDGNNPNIITNLIPDHYLQDATFAQGFENENAQTGDAYSYNLDFPGGGKIGSPQIIASLLFTWAKFFDEVKIFLDHFGKLVHIDYDSEDTISDWMLPFFANYYGFNLPNQFSAATISQWVEGEDLTDNAGVSSSGLRQIQSTIWRRILVNMSDIIRSKGTIHSVKAIMRAAGINPDSIFRFREFGGSNYITTKGQRVNRSEVAAMLFMTGSYNRFNSPFLSGSRIEIGWPYPQGSFVKVGTNRVGTNNADDGLLTSGSFTVEGIFQIDPQPHSLMQPTMSLARMITTGSTDPANSEALLANVVAFGTGSNPFITGSLQLFARPLSTGTDFVSLILTGVNVFDGDRWHVSFGRNIGTKDNPHKSSSYYVRAGKQNYGEMVQYSATSSYFYDPDSLWSKKSATYNASGSKVVVGYDAIGATGAGKFLNDATAVTDDNARYLNFQGKVAQVRFWSQALSVEEDKEHTRNFKSLGVEDPEVHFNFVTAATGAFERLRADISMDQVVTESNSSGELSLFDFSQNNLYFTASNFPTSAKVVEPVKFNYSILNPKFDERSSDNKVRIRSYEQDINIKEFNALKAPVRSLPEGQPITDDNRFSVEISSVRALNDDIMNIISSLDFFDNALGRPELQFSESYPALANLREVYFNRLTGRINYKNLIDFYKWFDDSLSMIIEQMLPRNTKYMGVNFVIESHALERPKMRYLQGDIYLGENDRRGLATDIFLQQIVGVLRRY